MTYGAIERDYVGIFRVMSGIIRHRTSILENQLQRKWKAKRNCDDSDTGLLTSMLGKACA